MVKPALFVLSICFVAILSCSKNKNVYRVSLQSKMTAKITKSSNVDLFYASGPSFITLKANGNTLLISAKDTLGGVVISDFTFIITYYIGVGIYDFDSTSSLKAYYETLGPFFKQTSFAYGRIVVTHTSGEYLSGLFSGVLTDGSEVSDGRFTIQNSQF